MKDEIKSIQVLVRMDRETYSKLIRIASKLRCSEPEAIRKMIIKVKE